MLNPVLRANMPAVTGGLDINLVRKKESSSVSLAEV